MSISSADVYEAAEALMHLKHHEIDQGTATRIKQVQKVARANDKVTAVWNRWGPDLLGWKTLMESAQTPLQKHFYEMMYQRNAYFYHQEMAKAKDYSAQTNNYAK